MPTSTHPTPPGKKPGNWGARRTLSVETIAARKLRVEELRRRRLKLGLSCKHLARIMNVHREYIWNIETNDSRFGVGMADRYENALKAHILEVSILAKQWGYL